MRRAPHSKTRSEEILGSRSHFSETEPKPTPQKSDASRRATIIPMITPRLTLLAALFAAPFLSAATHEVAASQYFNTFSHGHPVLKRVKPGDTIHTRTLDSAGMDQNGDRKANPSNPLTGPFYLEGAESGDAVAIHFTKMRLSRNWGWSAWRLGLFSLTPDYVEGIYSNKFKQDLVRQGRNDLVRWDIDLEKNLVQLKDPESSQIRMEFPARPMLGCVGVAPPGDFAPTSAPSGNYGGNLDFNVIGEGATVILPVYHPGALVFLGDGHALMADGEPTGTGVETSMEVEFTLELRKRPKVTGPRVETADKLISIGSQPEFASSLDRALQLATTDMVRWLVDDYQLEPWAAHTLIGYQGEYRVITVAGSMAVQINKNALKRR